MRARVALILLLLASGCARWQEAATVPAVQPGAPAITAADPARREESLAVTLPPEQVAPALPIVVPAAPVLLAAPMSLPAPTPPPSAVKPQARSPAPMPSPAAASAAPSPRAAAPPAAIPIVPSLDLDALKLRLRETEAIGLMAKLDLRSQVDALVKAFRVHHQSGQPTGIATLRQTFNLLVQKVLALLKDGDPALASMLSRSREAIWSVLEDPVKFDAAN